MPRNESSRDQLLQIWQPCNTKPTFSAPQRHSFRTVGAVRNCAPVSTSRLPPAVCPTPASYHTPGGCLPTTCRLPGTGCLPVVPGCPTAANCPKLAACQPLAGCLAPAACRLSAGCTDRRLPAGCLPAAQELGAPPQLLTCRLPAGFMAPVPAALHLAASTWPAALPAALPAPCRLQVCCLPALRPAAAEHVASSATAAAVSALIACWACHGIAELAFALALAFTLGAGTMSLLAGTLSALYFSMTPLAS